ncbi:MAG: sensor histidine kinase, partial [Actinomycetota bacterium]
MNPATLPIGRRPPLRALVTAVITTGAVTLLAVAGETVPPSVAALAYVLAVTASAARDGFWGGLAASGLSFVGLNFFFTPPRLTFAVEKTEDLIALFVFLAVAGIVGTLLSTSRAQRQRAERREREARLLHHVATKLLSGERLDLVLRRFGDAVVELLGLARCEIAADIIGEKVVIERAPAAGAGVMFPMATPDREVGRITATPTGSRELTQDERDVIRTFAGQMALALERMRFADDAHKARVEAEESRLRAALFSSVTHDLRTPLASITAAATSLEDAQTTFSVEDRRDLLETIRQEADRLNRLVGNLMDLARIRAGALTPSKALASVDEVIEGVLARLQSQLDGRHVRLVLREDLPEIPIDVVQIDQVLTNLIENALKFSSAMSDIGITAARWQSS